MRKAFILLFFCHIASLVVSAQAVPTYYSVLRHFSSHYRPNPDQYAQLSFAKRPDGWYVRVLEQDDPTGDASREYSKQSLLWSKAKHSYQPLTGFNKGPLQGSALAQFLKGATTDWYDMNRDLYFGYNGWDVDVISELEGKAGLNDTLLESLARAYGAYAHRYLWYQMGGSPISIDPLQQKRAPLDPIPAAAADSATAYIRKSAALYHLIASRNPSYPTLIGSAALKHNNQLLFGWHMMLLSGYPDKAATFLREVNFDNSQIRIAKLLLDECPPNAVLFTYGDNESYQPWYIQQTLGYRTDVSVINLSMLAIPRYLSWLRDEGRITFSLTKETFGKGIEYIYISPSAGADDPAKRLIKSAAALLEEVAGRAKGDGFTDKQFFTDSLFIPVTGAARQWQALPSRVLRAIGLPNRSYYTLGDLLLMDIVNSNIAERPIYFTSQQDGLFQPYQRNHGMAYELVPALLPQWPDTLALRHMEKAAADGEATIPIYNHADNQAETALGRLLYLHHTLAAYYQQKGDKPQMARHLDAALALVRKYPQIAGIGAFSTGYYLIGYGHNPKAGQALVEDFLQQLAAYGPDYDNALTIPEEDGGLRYITAAEEAYKAQGLNTKRLLEIRKQVLYQ